MDLSLTEPERQFALEVRSWLEANVEVAPDTDDLAASVAWGRAWQARLAAAHWVGINWPEEYGGAARRRWRWPSSTPSTRAAERRNS